MKLVVTGGGTGGHVYPGIALSAHVISSRPGSRVLFIGSSEGPEAAASRREGIDFLGLDLTGFAGQNLPKRIKSLFRFTGGFLECRKVLLSFAPDAVVGTGGYASAPACFAASSSRIPLVLHEMNMEPGLVTRVLARRASAVALAREETAEALGMKVRTEVTGIPIRVSIKRLTMPGERERLREEAAFLGLEPRRKTLLVFGGSQGASAINEGLWECLPEVESGGDLQVLHLTGEAGYRDGRRRIASERISGLPLSYVAAPYAERMELAYAAADLVVSRAGAGTVAELACARVPAVLVPYPFAGGHQRANARMLCEHGAARVIEQRGGSARHAVAEAFRVIDNPLEMEQMRLAVSSLEYPDAAEGITRVVEEVS